MPMSVVYATVNGRLVQENRGGNVTRYVADILGSLIQTRDAAGNQTSSMTYWPFGEVRTSSGTNPSSWGFCGTWGYYKDAASRFYVRMRTLLADLSRWLTVDPLWPREASYQYAGNDPVVNTDPSGLQMLIGLLLLDRPEINCGSQNAEVRKHLEDVCKNRIPQLPNGPMKDCLKKRCNNAVITCLPANDPLCNGGSAGVTPGPYGCKRRGFYLCPPAFDPKKYGCLGKTILHEMCHSCGEEGLPPGGDPEKYCEGLAVNTYGKGKPPCPK